MGIDQLASRITHLHDLRPQLAHRKLSHNRALVIVIVLSRWTLHHAKLLSSVNDSILKIGTKPDGPYHRVVLGVAVQLFDQLIESSDVAFLIDLVLGEGSLWRLRCRLEGLL